MAMSVRKHLLFDVRRKTEVPQAGDQLRLGTL